ncbi:PilW family protein [Leptolyngbya sp. FACHB-261]|uniref:PilW family protein n=1 Tax=Leptolyngbya sp. FACHB-261 TaxID=2692806 RepID=UPI001685A7B7|nr:type II secretion system protein [Leptolyngbya sp. FACHB-261]MBD2100728.1 type II secretion system protein [Leptolyngbya sp. FACHB-261]
MAIQKLKANLFRAYLLTLRQQKTQGFTLTELLITSVVAVLAVGGLLFLMTQLIGQDRQDFGRSETQREMAQALDYIAADLKEAVYVYEGECLSGSGPRVTNASDAGGCGRTQNLAASIGLPVVTDGSFTPVLAFWKQERTPYFRNPTGTQLLPTEADCARLTADQAECNGLRISQNAYTLVVYALARNISPTDIQQGPARIIRYRLRKYDPNQLSTLVKRYEDDPAEGFQGWTCKSGGPTATSCPTATVNDGSSILEAAALVDHVDFFPIDVGSDQFPPDCPPSQADLSQTDPCAATASLPFTYSLTPPKPASGNANASFYAYVTRPDASQAGLNQDVFVFLRGNAATRSGQPDNNRQAGYLPTLQTQAQIRSAFNRNPPLAN